MNTQTNHPLPALHGVEPFRLAFESMHFDYRGHKFSLELFQYVYDNSGFFAIDKCKPDGEWVTCPVGELGEDEFYMEADQLAKTGYDKDQFEPEFVKELCRRIDVALDREGVQ